MSPSTMQSNQSAQKFGLRISEISCNGLPRVGRFFKRLGSFYLVANVTGIMQRTSVAQPSRNPLWEDVLEFNLDGNKDNELTIQVINQRRPGKIKLVGELISPIPIAHDFSDTKRIPEQTLVLKGKKNLWTGTVSFTLTRPSYPDASESSRAQRQLANAAAGRIEGKTKLETVSGYASKAEEITGAVAEFVKTWKSLLDKVDVVVKIGNKIAEIHPYAQMVWSILSPLLKAIDEQRKRDKKLMVLVEAMNDAYDFVDLTKLLQVENLNRDDTRKEIIKQMLQQTYNCAWFIRDYSSSGFIDRAVDGMTTNHDSMVQQYIENFNKLKEGFNNGTLVSIEITIHQTLALVQKTHDDSMLSGMVFARNRDIPNECLAGTRKDILKEIIDWIHLPLTSPEDPGPCVYWLHGVAGCGKSAIASTIAQKFNGSGVKRCARYFFDASRQVEAGPEKLFSTLSRTFADLDYRWRELLVKIVESSQDARTTLSIKEQFEKLILEPAKDFKPVGPILVVIDALDECGSERDRYPLLQMLSRLGELSSYGNFRFLITSRPEADIQEVFRNKSWIVPQDLAEADEHLTDDDIRLYVRKELSRTGLPGVPLPVEHSKDAEDLVVTRAGHLFQWAFVACSYIRGNWEFGVIPTERYRDLHDDSTDAPLDTLVGLYKKVLTGLFGSSGKNNKIVRFRKVLGRILSAREPLSLETLTKLDPRPMEESEREVKSIVRSLGSLLKGAHNDHDPIQPLHTSFREFLLDPQRSGEFYVGSGSEDAVLARSSLLVMNNELRFNICELETSYVRNRDVENLPDRVEKAIPKHLSYACRYFAEHLSNSGYDEDLLKSIDLFLRKKLLFWFEALSLLKNISQALMELSELQTWAKKNSASTEGVSLIDDALRFVRAYGGTMEMSTPHIYLSLIAFIPPNSPLHKAYSGDYPGGLKVASNGGQPVKWTSALLRIPTSGSIQAVGFSPNGKLIVSGSSDSTVRIWDVHTGQPVGDPFQGHTWPVNSVGFSPDGKLVVSGSHDSTVRVWDVHTGQPVGDPFQGHTSSVNSVGFSPDGKLVVSGSDDSTVRVWDVHTGQPVGDPFQGHTSSVFSVGFSPDGKLVVSGSSDSTVRVWDVHTGQPVGHPFQGHTDSVFSVGFSPDGKLVVSGSNDSTVRVWDMHTGQPVCRLFQDHTPVVTSAEFLPDASLVTSRLDGNSLCVRSYPALLLSGNSSISLKSLHEPEYQQDLLLSNNKVHYTDSSEIDDDGWVLGPSSELLFWVPPAYRPNLWRPSNIAVIGANSIKLDFMEFVHGENWRQCCNL